MNNPKNLTPASMSGVDLYSLEPAELGRTLAAVIEAIPGGIGICELKDGYPLFIYVSEGVCMLSGRTIDQYRAATREDPMALVHPLDRARVLRVVRECMENGKDLSISYRVFHLNGSIVWLHLNGRYDRNTHKLYTIFNGMSSEDRLFQTIATEMAEAIYVIARGTGELLYVSESSRLAHQGCSPVGRKCHEVLYNRSAPCPGCHLSQCGPGGDNWQPEFERNGRFYINDVCETDWNGIPAYVKYVRDVTDTVSARREKDDMERYFQNVLQKIPGGAAVIRVSDCRVYPEYLSDGLAHFIDMDPDEFRALHSEDPLYSFWPADRQTSMNELNRRMLNRETSFEITHRMTHSNGSPIWVCDHIYVSYESESEALMYLSVHDITGEINNHEQLNRIYNEKLLEHYHSSDPNALIIGHGNLTDNIMVDVIDRTGNALESFRGAHRDNFYSALSEWIVEDEERESFIRYFRSSNLIADHSAGVSNRQFDLFMKFPSDAAGRYVRVHVQLAPVPDTGALTGILSITDVTEKTVSRNAQKRLSEANCETLIDVDLTTDCFRFRRFRGQSIENEPTRTGYAASVRSFAEKYVAPKDRLLFAHMTHPDTIRETMQANKPMSFAYTLLSANGDVSVKSLTVLETDRRLGRVCIAMNDITRSVQEQQGLLNMMAYTFEMVAFIDLASRSVTVHTRQSILNYRPPLYFSSFENVESAFDDDYCHISRLTDNEGFYLHNMLERLERRPGGYEFITSNPDLDPPRYKQINVLWGDANRNTICIVRADVTDMIVNERENKRHLEEALQMAESANQAKTDFLSSMSHDIRTPMNAIIGMTDLALAHIDDTMQVQESLETIRGASDHLLHMINDILDMSRIESGRLTIYSEPFSHMTEMHNIVSRTRGLAEKRGVQFMHHISVSHDHCIGDTHRIHQILDNLLSNAIKFTPAGGKVLLHVEETEGSSNKIGCFRYMVEDTGIGMTEEEVRMIFEPFFRTETVKRRHIEGTGLGMSIVKNLLDFIGGSIQIESQPGWGTRIIVELPLKYAEDFPEQEEDSAACPDLRGKRILLVEDHPINQLVARRILESMNAIVEIASDGLQGSDLFISSGADDFDAICMDLRMPVMDGYEAAARIRASSHPRAKSVPIIAMTANAFAQDVRKCFEAGMTAHISKPITPKALTQLFASWPEKS